MGVQVIRVEFEGLAALMTSSPSVAVTYLEEIRTLLSELATSFGATLKPTSQGGHLLVFPVGAQLEREVALQAVALAQRLRTELVSPSLLNGVAAPLPTRIALYQADMLYSSHSPDVVATRVEHEGTDLVKLCPVGEICVSETLQGLLQGDFRARPLGFVGRGGRFQAGAFLLGSPRLRVPGSDLRPLEVETLVGRERELAHLSRRYSDVQRGGGSRFITVVATPGMGRTRLIESFLWSIQQQGGAFQLIACEEHSSMAPLQPVVELLTQLLDIASDDDDDTVALRLMLAARAALAATEGPEGRVHDPDVVELSVMLGELLGTDVTSRERSLEPSILEPESLRQRTFFCLLKLLRGLTQAKPMAVVFENLHLADSATLEFLQYLGRMLRGSGNLLVVGSTVPGFSELCPQWGRGWTRHETLTLSPVDGDEIKALVRRIAGRNAASMAVDAIVRQSHGKPGLADLMARAFADLHGGDQEEASESEEIDGQTDSIDEQLEAPESPLGDLESEKDDREGARESPPEGAKESPSEAAPLQSSPQPKSSARVPNSSRAAQPQYSFEEGAGDDAKLEEGVTVTASYQGPDEEGSEEDDAEMVSFLEQDPLGELEHLLPGEVWALRLRRISDNARKLLGIAAIAGRTLRGEVIAAQWGAVPEDAESLESLLGELQQQGLLTRRPGARPWEASWRFRSTLLHRVVYDSISMAERHRLHRQLARLLEGDGVGATTRVSYALVAYHFDQGNEADRALRYYVMAGKAARRAVALKEAEKLFVRALSLVKESGFPDGGQEAIALHHLLGQIQSILNEPRRALNELETALQYARVRRDPKIECEILMSLCDLLDREGDHNRLMEVATQALDLARAARNTRNVILSLRRIGWEQVRAGRPDEGRAALEEAVQVAVESQKIEQLTLAMDSLGAFYYLRGNYGLAVRGYEDLLGHLRRTIRSRGAAAQTL